MGGDDLGFASRRMRRDCMFVRSALFDLSRGLGSSALARVEECAQKEESYDEGYYDLKMGLLKAACDEEERTGDMLALDLSIVVQGRHFDDDPIPIVERRGRRGGRRGSSWAPDSRLALVLASTLR